MSNLIRTEKLIGKVALTKFSTKKIAIFGLGGVGSFAAEAIARCGIGYIDLYDFDTVSLSNINRQLIALNSTVGKKKVAVMKERILDINPTAEVNAFDVRYSLDNADNYLLEKYDYVIDAVDTVTSKLELIVRCKKANVPIISCMGTGNKIRAEFEITDIYKTSVCPLAKVMRRELKLREITSLKVLYSKETPSIFENSKNSDFATPDTTLGETLDRRTPASISFVPSVAGLLIAGEVIRDLLATE